MDALILYWYPNFFGYLIIDTILTHLLFSRTRRRTAHLYIKKKKKGWEKEPPVLQIRACNPSGTNTQNYSPKRGKEGPDPHTPT